MGQTLSGALQVQARASPCQGDCGWHPVLLPLDASSNPVPVKMSAGITNYSQDKKNSPLLVTTKITGFEEHGLADSNPECLSH